MEPTISQNEQALETEVLRMIIWGESPQAAFEMLENNGIFGSQARDMVGRARAVRMRMIRRTYWPRIFWGVLCLLIGGFFLWNFFQILNDVNAVYDPLHGRRKGGAFMLAGVFLVIGTWKFINGLVGMFMAPWKKGALYNDWFE